MTVLTFGQKLMILRRNKHLSQKKLAAETGIGVANIARYELDASLPNVQTLIKLSDFFEVSIDYLIKNSGPASITKDPELLSLMTQIEQCDDKQKELIKDMIRSLARIPGK